MDPHDDNRTSIRTLQAHSELPIQHNSSSQKILQIALVSLHLSGPTTTTANGVVDGGHSLDGHNGTPADSRLHSKVRDERMQIDLQRVSEHNQANDCWLVIYDRVYDVTEFLREVSKNSDAMHWIFFTIYDDVQSIGTQHPGGIDVLLEYAGRDASLAFRSCGHTEHAFRLLRTYEIGELPTNERIFRCKGGVPMNLLLDDS